MTRSLLPACAALLFASLSSPAPVGGPLQVVSVTPRLNQLDAARTTAITVRFDQPVELASFTDRTFHVFGMWSGITPGSLAITASGDTVSFVPRDPFSAGERVFVTMARNLRAATGASMSRGYAFSFWTDARAGSRRFTNVQTLIPGVTPYGGYGGDIDGDEDLDLCTPNENSLDVSVFLNDGTGFYSHSADYGVGLHCSPSEPGDFDFDGNLDLAVANISDDTVSVLFGNGDGTFQPQVLYAVGDSPRGLATLDVDGDGDHDLVTANRNVGGTLTLLVNDGTGVFAQQPIVHPGLTGETGVAAADMDNDGLFDLVVIGITSDNVRTLFADGNGGFTLGTVRPIGNGPWMVVVGDVDRDGFNDVGAANSQGSSAGVALNDGTGDLGPAQQYASGSFPLAIDFGDLDGDGHLDMTASAYGGGVFNIYYNDGDGTFSSGGTLPSDDAGSCTVLHDQDGDGDLDIAGIDELADRVYIFRQDG